MGISIFSAVLLLVSSSLLLNEVTHLSNYPTPLGEMNLCQAQRHIGRQTCGHLQVSAVSPLNRFFSFFFHCGLCEVKFNWGDISQTNGSTKVNERENRTISDIISPSSISVIGQWTYFAWKYQDGPSAPPSHPPSSPRPSAPPSHSPHRCSSDHFRWSLVLIR